MRRGKGKAHLLVAAAVVVGAASLAFGSPRELLLCVTGFPGTTDQARPTVQGFLDALAAKAGWGAGAIAGDYYPDSQVGIEQIRSRQPGFAAMSLDLYLAHGAELNAEVIAKAKMHGRDRMRYSIVVAKEGGPATADALSGSVIVPFRESARFLGNLVLDGKRTLAEGLTLQYEANATSALRKVARGQAAAAVVEEEVIARFDEFPMKDQLRVLVTGPWLPGPPVCALPTSAAADRTAMRDALVGLCSTAAEQCTSIRVDAFLSATSADYAEVQALFDR